MAVLGYCKINHLISRHFLLFGILLGSSILPSILKANKQNQIPSHVSNEVFLDFSLNTEKLTESFWKQYKVLDSKHRRNLNSQEIVDKIFDIQKFYLHLEKNKAYGAELESVSDNALLLLSCDLASLGWAGYELQILLQASRMRISRIGMHLNWPQENKKYQREINHIFIETQKDVSFLKYRGQITTGDQVWANNTPFTVDRALGGGYSGAVFHASNDKGEISFKDFKERKELIFMLRDHLRMQLAGKPIVSLIWLDTEKSDAALQYIQGITWRNMKLYWNMLGYSTIAFKKFSDKVENLKNSLDKKIVGFNFVYDIKHDDFMVIDAN